MNKWQEFYNKVYPWLCMMEYGFEFDWIRLKSLKWYPVRLKEIEVWLCEDICIKPYSVHKTMKHLELIRRIQEMKGVKVKKILFQNNVTTNYGDVYVILQDGCDIYMHEQEQPVTLDKHMCLFNFSEQRVLTFDNTIMKLVFT